MSGMRVLVIGLARAGSGMANALAKSGANVIVADQKSADALTMLEAIDKLSARGIEVITSWTGDVDWQNTDVIAPSPGVASSHPVLREAVDRGVPIWSEIEVAYRIAKAPIIGITGTNGKSTTTALTYFLLKQCGANAVLCGNIAGSGLPEQPITSAALSSPEDAVLVAEISSFQLEWIDEFRPSRAAITRITADHLDRYHTFEQYAAAKLNLYRNQTEADIAAINTERPETIIESMRARKLTYGGEGANVAVREHSIASQDIEIQDSALWARGKHNLDNAACAWLLAGTYVPMGEAAKAMPAFKGIANRMEFVGERDGRRFVNNSMCTNPDALMASMGAATPPIVLIAGGVSKVENSFVGLATKGVRQAVIFGRDAASIRKAFESEGVGCDSVETISQAFERAIAISKPGDTILLSPGAASFDQFEDFIQRGEAFRSLVQSYVGGVIA